MNEPLWKIWRNPIVRRFATARLRWAGLLAWGVVLQAFAASFWLGFFFFQYRQMQRSAADAALVAWFPILIFQGALWLMKGTFSVATGIAREGVEGLTEAQVLTPLSSWQKTLGYLIGLPIRETVLVLTLVPWTVISALLAHIPLEIVLRIHLLLAAAALVHHALGLVAGTVIKQKIIAGTVSQVLVILLHGVVPVLALLGLGPLGPLGHLNVASAISTELAPLFPAATSRWDPSTVRALTHIPFFRWEFTLTGYQWTVMTMLLGVLLTILWRRWQRPTAHMFSKPLALAFFSWIVVLSLGEIVPRIDGPNFFAPKKARAYPNAVHVPADGQPGNLVQQAQAAKSLFGPAASQAGFALLWAAGFGAVGLFASMLLAASVAPTLDQHWRARRALARHAGARLPWADDARSAVPWSFALAAVLIVGWHYLVRQFLDSSYLRLLVTGLPSMPYLLGAAVLVPLLVWTLLVEWRGLRFALMMIFVVWILPLMVVAVSVLSGVPWDGWPRWCLGASGLVLPLFGLSESLGGVLQVSFGSNPFHVVWLTSIAAHAFLAVVLFACLRRAQRPHVETATPGQATALADPVEERGGERARNAGVPEIG